MVAKVEDYSSLTDIEHVLLRPGMYIGNVKNHTQECYVFDNEAVSMSKQEITYNPGLIKLFDEVISNSVDESLRTHSNLDVIKVQIDRDKNKITVYDNGGIPVKISENGVLIPEMIFSELRAGSNFDDSKDSIGTGQNGIGGSLTNIFSTEFIVETADGKKKFRQKFTSNMNDRTKASVSPCDKNYTKITFTPDLERLDCKLDDDNYNALVKRIYDIAGCNPGMKIYLNGKKLNIKSFKDYIGLYTEDFVYDSNEHWNIGLASSDGGFQHISFVNSTETMIGGSHINYISDQITNKLRVYFEKKHKVKVKPSEIRNHLRIFIDCTIVNPRYSSQTKSDLITEPRDYKTEFVVTDKFINKVIKSDVIQEILEWVEAKKNAAELAALRKTNKQNAKTNPNKIVKLSDATEKDDRSICELFLTEGDCIHEDTNIHISRDNIHLDLPMKDITIGDLVLTDKNRYKPILSKSNSVKEGVLIITADDKLLVSQQHKMLIYDKTTNSFYYHKAEDINPDIHKLVKSRIITDTCLTVIEKNESIDDIKYDRNITFGEVQQKCTDDHEYFIFEYLTHEYRMVKAIELTPFIHGMVIKKK